MAYTQKRRTTHPGEKQTDEYLRENMITDAERAANRGMPSSNWMTEVSDGQNGYLGCETARHTQRQQRRKFGGFGFGEI